MWRHPRIGQWLPAVVLPPELAAALAGEVLAAYQRSASRRVDGLAFSPDERVLYVANTRQAAYIHRIELDSAGNMVRRSIFADMSSDEKVGVPDGMKVDVQGNVYCTGPGGTWVYAADGTHIGTIKTPKCRPISPLADRT